VTAASTLAVEQPSDGVTIVRLNRPERLNAINEALLGELSETCAAIAVD
jgi:enoyl-CoA hydratase